MSLLSRAVRAYQRGGATRVINGGLHLVTEITERNIIEKTRWEIPYYVWKNIRKSKQAMMELSKKGIGPPITEVSLSQYKTSDTLFVLGSGSSINDISEKQWEYINQHDSVGLNRWPVHKFTPTYHVFEIRMGQEKEKFRSMYWKLLNYKKNQYKNIPIILKDVSVVCDELEPHHLPEWLAGDLIVSCDSGFSSIIDLDTSSETNRELLEYLYEKGYFEKGKIEILYRKRASISYLLHFGAVLGYKNIVFCGIDMVDSKYFFDEEGESYDDSDVPVPRHDNDTDEGEHRTNDPDIGKLTIEKIIYTIDEVIFESEGINLYVENRMSALHPQIPLYRYK